MIHDKRPVIMVVLFVAFLASCSLMSGDRYDTWRYQTDTGRREKLTQCENCISRFRPEIWVDHFDELPHSFSWSDIHSQGPGQGQISRRDMCEIHKRIKIYDAEDCDR